MAKDLFNKNDLIIFGIIVFLIIILYFKKTENLEVEQKQDLTQVEQKQQDLTQVEQKQQDLTQVPLQSRSIQVSENKIKDNKDNKDNTDPVSQEDLSMNKIKMDGINIVEKSTTENIRTDSTMSQNLNDDFRMKVCNMCTPFNSGFGAGISVDQYSNLENENKDLKGKNFNLQNQLSVTRDQYSNLENENKDLKDKNNDLQNKLRSSVTREQYSNLKNIINNLQNENTNLKNENTNLKIMYNTLVDRHNNIFKKCPRLHRGENLTEAQLPKKI